MYRRRSQAEVQDLGVSSFKRMKSTEFSKPITIPDDLIARCDGPDQLGKFDKFFRAVIAVPKSEIDTQEAKWKRSRAKKTQAKNMPVTGR
ncbi:MAG: hypothetical protein ACR2IV_13575 [Bryobacteraceae bacterium]